MFVLSEKEITKKDALVSHWCNKLFCDVALNTYDAVREEQNMFYRRIKRPHYRLKS